MLKKCTTFNQYVDRHYTQFLENLLNILISLEWYQWDLLSLKKGKSSHFIRYTYVQKTYMRNWEVMNEWFRFGKFQEGCHLREND